MTEDDLKLKCGKTNPFKVPEGYFEDFERKLMERLPEQLEHEEAAEADDNHTVTLWQRVKPWFYMAAMMGGMAWLIGTLPGLGFAEQQSDAVAESGMMTDEEVDTIMEYAMMDDYLLYRYLTDAE